jgi:hypothetical protein
MLGFDGLDHSVHSTVNESCMDGTGGIGVCHIDIDYTTVSSMHYSMQDSDQPTIKHSYFVSAPELCIY